MCAASSSVIFWERPRLGQLPRLLGFGLVNVVQLQSPCRLRMANAVAGDLHKAIADGDENRVLPLLRDDFARDKLRHQRHVLRQNAHLALRAGERDHVHVVGEKSSPPV